MLLQAVWWYTSYLLWSAVLVAAPAFVATSTATYPGDVALPLQVLDRYVAGVSRILFLLSCAFSALQTLIREHAGMQGTLDAAGRAAGRPQGADVPPEVATPALRTAIAIARRASRALFSEFCAPRQTNSAAEGASDGGVAPVITGNPLALLGTLMSVAAAPGAVPPHTGATRGAVRALTDHAGEAAGTATAADTTSQPSEEDWYGKAGGGASVSPSVGKNETAAAPFARAALTRRRTAAAAAAKLRANMNHGADSTAQKSASKSPPPAERGSSDTAESNSSDADASHGAEDDAPLLQ